MCGHMTFFAASRKKFQSLPLSCVNSRQEKTSADRRFLAPANIHADTRSARACPKDERRSNPLLGGFREEPASIASAGAVDDEAGGELWEKATAAEQIAINRRAKERIRRMKPPCNETKNNLYNTILQANDKQPDR